MKALIFINLITINFIFAQENNSILCSDGIDNDGNGLIDCEDLSCFTLSNNGCSICSLGISFADTVLEYVSGCPIIDPFPLGSLGVSDYTGSTMDSPDFVFLGQGGFIKLGFTNNLVTNSGDNEPDIYVFEVGPLIEPMSLAIRPADLNTEQLFLADNIPDIDSDGYFEIGDIAGSTSSIDLDVLIPNSPANSLFFDAIKIMDIIDLDCGQSGAPGADIDAVCALSYIILDCAGIFNGTSIIDSCGVCLEKASPNFNQSCIDHCDIFLPNIFSPNSDQINEKFIIYTCDEKNYRVLDFSIFNRGGNLVYNKSDFKIKDNSMFWDGTFNGNNVSLGVYTYIVLIELGGKEIKRFSGDITLIR